MIKTSLETITPEKAREYLKANTDNYRKLQRHVVKRYADDILKGRWEVNGESICFNEAGVLLNGQHRLAAVILADREIQTVVVRGISKDVSMYDVGSVRTIPQIASHEGIDCNPTISAAANIIVNNFRPGRGKSAVVDYIRENIDELNRAYRVACYGSQHHMSKCGVAIAACYLMIHTRAIPVYEAELFFRLFNDPWTTRADGYDISAAVNARNMFEDRERKNGYQIQKEKLEILCQAMADFHEKTPVPEKYMIHEPFFYSNIMDEVHKLDGIN